ncbi:MAG: hypothetical protein H7Z75_15775 [Ferruginibacter sp.]|nr:hypothetical protein [Cytophagales bacterium]
MDKRAMTAEELLDYEMTLSANALAIKNEQKKIGEARQEERINAVKKAILRGKLTTEEIAEDNAVSVDFVVDIQNQLAKSK